MRLSAKTRDLKKSSERQVSIKQRRQTRFSFRDDLLTTRQSLTYPEAVSAREIQALQRTVGNQATTHFIQAKLRVGPVGDRYEREADRVAHQVMTMPDAPARSPVQRQAGEEEEVQTKRAAPAITPVVQRQEEEELQLQSLQRQEEELQLKSGRREWVHGQCSDGVAVEISARYRETAPRGVAGLYGAAVRCRLWRCARSPQRRCDAVEPRPECQGLYSPTGYLLWGGGPMSRKPLPASAC